MGEWANEKTTNDHSKAANLKIPLVNSNPNSTPKKTGIRFHFLFKLFTFVRLVVSSTHSLIHHAATPTQLISFLSLSHSLNPASTECSAEWVYELFCQFRWIGVFFSVFLSLYLRFSSSGGMVGATDFNPIMFLYRSSLIHNQSKFSRKSQEWRRETERKIEGQHCWGSK